jgi:hypothetical protein
MTAAVDGYIFLATTRSLSLSSIFPRIYVLLWDQSDIAEAAERKPGDEHARRTGTEDHEGWLARQPGTG